MTPAQTIVADIALVVTFIVIFTGFLQNLIQLIQLGLAWATLLRRAPAGHLGAIWNKYADVMPPIALLVPAYNEEKTIVETVHSLLSLRYPSIEVIVVNDGSRDNTLAVLTQAFSLQPAARAFEQQVPNKPVHGLWVAARDPRLLVVDKVNGGRADALNAAVNFARAPIVCQMDADSLLDEDALLRAVRPFVDNPERTVAVGATIRIANGCRVHKGRIVEVGLPKSWLALFQTVEYLRAFLMARLALSEMNMLFIVSGAFGLFRRQIVVEVGGFSTNTVGEDFELVMKIHRYMLDRRRDYRIEFLPEPVCWTEAPEDLRTLGQQRSRWQRGAIETFAKYWDMMLKPRYGRIGAIGVTNTLIVDIIGPFAEVAGYFLIPLLWLLDLLSIEYFLALTAVIFAFGVAISVGSLVLEELELRRFPRARDLFVLTLAAILENFGYRQLNNFWRIRGYWQYFTGKGSWGEMTRKGFKKS